MWPPNGIGISLYAFGRKSKLDIGHAKA